MLHMRDQWFDSATYEAAVVRRGGEAYATHVRPDYLAAHESGKDGVSVISLRVKGEMSTCS
jgi:hypothetical protein